MADSARSAGDEERCVAPFACPPRPDSRPCVAVIDVIDHHLFLRSATSGPRGITAVLRWPAPERAKRDNLVLSCRHHRTRDAASVEFRKFRGETSQRRLGYRRDHGGERKLAAPVALAGDASRYAEATNIDNLARHDPECGEWLVDDNRLVSVEHRGRIDDTCCVRAPGPHAIQIGDPVFSGREQYLARHLRRFKQT